jgi:hypothetical protein
MAINSFVAEIQANKYACVGLKTTLLNIEPIISHISLSLKVYDVRFI